MLGRVRMIPGRATQNPDGTLVLPRSFSSDKSPRWGQWRVLKTGRPRLVLTTVGSAEWDDIVIGR